MTKIFVLIAFLISTNSVFYTNAIADEKGGEVGNPIQNGSGFEVSENDFFAGPGLREVCNYGMHSYQILHEECIKDLKGRSISKYIMKGVVQECLSQPKWDEPKKDVGGCLSKFDGKAYPKQAQRACFGLSASACEIMFKDSIIQYPLVPKKELLAEVQKNIQSGNYARVKFLMDVILSKEKYVASGDKCVGSTPSLEVSDTRIDKLKQVVDQIEKKSKTTDR